MNRFDFASGIKVEKPKVKSLIGDYWVGQVLTKKTNLRAYVSWPSKVTLVAISKSDVKCIAIAEDPRSFHIDNLNAYYE